jgi:phenylacetate-CoA ligase
VRLPQLQLRAHGWYHVNSDWAALEPVDADGRPVPPGRPSHTVLLTNLANRVQPILRYDLGDSVLLRPDPCPCGSPLPAIRVQGRAADVLTFPGVHGEQVSLSPMLFGTLLDRVPGVEQFQVVQTAPTTLRVRLQPGAAVDPDRVWHAVHDGIDRLLTDSKADHVTVERAEEPPQPAPSGKYRRVVPFSA